VGCGGSANDAQHRPILGRGRRPRRRAEGNHRRARGLSPARRNRRAKRKSARTEATRGRSESFEVESCPGRAGARAGVPVQQIPACRRRESPAGVPETLVEGRCPRSRIHAARDIASRRSPLHRAFPSIRPRRMTTRRVRGRVVGPSSLRPRRAHPCGAQEENPLDARCLSSPAESLNEIRLSAPLARDRLRLDHIAELPHGDLAAEADERVECRIGATHLEAR